jgi:hypothetical protein
MQDAAHTHFVDVPFPADLEDDHPPANGPVRRRSSIQVGTLVLHFEREIYVALEHSSNMQSVRRCLRPADKVYGCFRSLQAQPSMDAIDEFEEEIFDETLMFDLVCLGGGTAAGHWASALTNTDNNTSTSSTAQTPLQERSLTAAIISGYPAGLPPYERSWLHSTALNPSLSAARDSSQSGFPAVDGHTAEWYAAVGSELSKAIKQYIQLTVQTLLLYRTLPVLLSS